MRQTDYITVFAYPIPAISANLTLACVPAAIQFTDKSVAGAGTITSWNWNFGDGTSSSETNPTHTYTQTGYYTVGLKVTNSGGCSNSYNLTRYLRLVDGIQPNFDWDQTSADCSAPYTLQYRNQAAGPGNLTYNWSLGGGATPSSSTAANPAGIVYNTGGTYTVILQVTSDLGCSAQIQQPVSLSNNTAAITGPTQICINTPATFTNGSSPTPSSAAWVFDNGAPTTGSNVSNTFASPGTHQLKLINTYASCIDSTTETITVVTQPTVDFTAEVTSSCKAPLTVHFTDKTSPAANSWSWDFGDGTTSTDQNPVHTYTSTNTYNVTLTVGTSAGCSNSTTKTGFIIIRQPTITFNASTLGACVSSTPTNNTLYPLAQISSIDPVVSYSWIAPGASPSTSAASNPGFQFSSPGIYTISLSIMTAGGCGASLTANNAVQIGTPTTPSITAIPNPVCGKQPVTFSDNTTPADHWNWFFGDGSDTVTTVPSVSHRYKSTGDNSVTLTLVNQGCAQTTVKTITVNPPIASFSFKTGCPNGFDVAFKDGSLLDTKQPVTYLWNFGDPASGANNTASGADPEHIFTNKGTDTATYIVTLIVINGSCSDTVSNPITLGPTTAAFTPAPSYCENKLFTLTSNSSNPSLITNYNWTTDDGKTHTDSLPSWTISYFSPGNHTVTLTVTDIYGCSSSVTQPITISGPIGKFIAPDPAGGCVDKLITFTDASTVFESTQPIVSWYWNYGDGSDTLSYTNTAVTHVFKDTGYYVVYLTVKDANGCASTYNIPRAFQATAPQALFSGPDSFYCPQELLTLKDRSQGYGISENWSWGDGASSAAPTHTFGPANQTYTVVLNVTDQYGCTASATDTVRIQSPVAAFDISDTTAICTPLETYFTPHAQYYDSLYWDFGDGTTSTLPTTSHFYNSLNTFTATLYVQGPGGCMASTNRKVMVLNPQSTVFTYSPLRQCDSILVTFNIVPLPWTKWTLYFDDGAADSTMILNPAHMYRTPKSYGPSMYITDPTGCIVQVSGQSGNVTVLGAVPFFTVNKSAFCDQGVVNFADYSITNDGVAQEIYNFGDASPIVTQSDGIADFNTQHDYTTPGFWPATLQVITNTGCKAAYTDTIAIYQTPHPVIQTKGLLCTGLIQFEGSLTDPQVDTIYWNWTFGNGQTGAGQQTFSNFAPGNYTVQLKTSVSLGCSDDTTFNLTVFPLPSIIGPREITTPVGVPADIPFTYSDNIVSYTWTPAEHLNCTDCADPKATLINSERYQVTVLDANSCANTDTILIRTICNDKNYFLPNTFSPNGDGVNDFFYPRGSNLYNIQSMQVFNRWGQKVFERRDFPANAANMGWDGTFNGRPAPSDAYVYFVQVLCDNSQVVVLKGDITLVR